MHFEVKQVADVFAVRLARAEGGRRRERVLRMGPRLRSALAALWLRLPDGAADVQASSPERVEHAGRRRAGCQFP